MPQLVESTVGNYKRWQQGTMSHFNKVLAISSRHDLFDTIHVHI